jgi:hypothetical protein
MLFFSAQLERLVENVEKVVLDAAYVFQFGHGYQDHEFQIGNIWSSYAH